MLFSLQRDNNCTQKCSRQYFFNSNQITRGSSRLLLLSSRQGIYLLAFSSISCCISSQQHIGLDFPIPMPFQLFSCDKSKCKSLPQLLKSYPPGQLALTEKLTEETPANGTNTQISTGHFNVQKWMQVF